MGWGKTMGIHGNWRIGYVHPSGSQTWRAEDPESIDDVPIKTSIYMIRDCFFPQ
jgi:hypothetical protein